MITTEQLEAKLAQLKTQLEQLRANMIATEGAIMLCEMLIRETQEQKSPGD